VLPTRHHFRLGAEVTSANLENGIISSAVGMNGLRELIQARREETKKSASISLGASKFVRRGDRRPRPDNNIMDELSGDISSRPQKRSRGDAGLV